MMMIDSIRTYALAVTLLLTAGGCGVEVVGGAQRGEVETVVVDSPPEGQSASSRAPSSSWSPVPESASSSGSFPASEPDPGPAAFLSAPASRLSASLSPLPAGHTLLLQLPSGTVEADLSIALLTAADDVELVTDGVVGAAVGIASPDSLRVGLAELRPRSYSRVRLTFTRVEAVLSTPFDAGGGLVLEGRVRVDLGAAPLVIDVPLAVAVRDDERVTVVVDLHSSAWIGQATPIARLVPAAAFRSAVTVRLR
jgi:hypothetical protein